LFGRASNLYLHGTNDAVQDSKEKQMKSQNDEFRDKRQSNNPQSNLAYLAVGLGVGALLGIALAPQSGKETRQWIATKYQDGMDSVQATVTQTRQNVGDFIDRNQQQVTAAVDAGREAFRKAKAGAA
jgi:gas vesicle protein